MIKFVLRIKPEFEQAFSRLDERDENKLYQLLVKSVMSIPAIQGNASGYSYTYTRARHEYSVTMQGILNLDTESLNFISQMISNEMYKLGIDRLFSIIGVETKANAYDQLLAPQEIAEINHNTVIKNLFIPDHEFPEEFICPITGEVMHNPAYLITNPKVNYEYSALQRFPKTLNLL